MSAARETTAGESEVSEAVATPAAAAATAALLEPAALARAPLARRAAAVAALQRSAGNGAVAQILAREPAKAGAAKAADPNIAGWKDLPFGETLYKKIIEKYTPEELLKLALPQLGKLPKQIPEANSAAAASVAVPFAQKAAEEWMKTEGGKKFLADAATWVKQHPDAVYWTLVGAMAAAIAGAAIAYFSGAFAPGQLDEKFKLLGFDVGAGADLGKFTEVILKSAKLSIGRDLGGGVTASVAGDVAEGGDKGWSGSATGKLGTKDVFGSYQLKWDEKGVAGQSFSAGAYGLTGAYNWGKEESGQLEYKLKPLIIPIETTAMVKFNADGSALLDASALYKSAQDGTYKLGVKGPLAGGKPDDAMLFTLGRSNTGAGGASASSEWTLNPNDPSKNVGKYDFKMPILPGLTLAQGFKVGDSGVLGYDTKLTGEALKGAIKAELAAGQDEKGVTTASGGVAIKVEDAEWAVRAAFTDGELSELAMKMGFGGKEDAVKFLVDASLSRKDGVDKATLKAMLTAKVGKFATKFEGNVSETVGGKTPGTTIGGSAAAVVTLPAGVLLGASADVSYASKAGLSAGPGVLVGHEWSPVLLKGSVMIPVGSEGPPVWGLSAVGRF